MVSLFEDPKQIVRADKVIEFWPTKIHTSAERVNATARFIIYATCILYLIRRDVRVFILGSTSLGVLYVMEMNNMIKEGQARPTSVKEGYESACQLPTYDNPMANVLMSDFADRPDRPSACDYATVQDDVNHMLSGTIPYGPQRSRSAMPEFQRKAYARQFVSSPVTNIPGDQTGFAEWLYGEKGGSICRSDSRACDPNARGVQLEAFAGLDVSGDIRGPRGGGAVRSGSGSYA